jgi:hypothetical protein
MSGYDFNLRVLQPWARDPAFYATVRTEQSDTPAHEGPNAHRLVELWTYSFPLTPKDEARLAADLRTIPPFLKQARQNLTGNARDLWITGAASIQGQVADLEELKAKVAHAGKELQAAVSNAHLESLTFLSWLNERAPSKTGPRVSARRATPGRSSTSTCCP